MDVPRQLDAPATRSTAWDVVRVAVVGGTRIRREGLAAALDRFTAIDVVLDEPGGAAVDVIVLEHPAAAIAPIGAAGAQVVAVGHSPTDQPVSACVPADASLTDLVHVVVDLARARASVGDGDPGPAPGSAGDAAPTAMPPLTGRETQVLALVEEALSNREIAERLHVEVSTVKNHMHSLLQKLGATRRAQAAAWFRANAPRGG